MRFLKLIWIFLLSAIIVIVFIKTVTFAAAQPLVSSKSHSISDEEDTLPPNISATIAENIVFDFEGTAEGWEPSTKSGEKGISAVYPTSTRSYSGQYSLAMDMYLSYSAVSTDFNQGIVLVMLPGNMEGHTITAKVWCPSNAVGDSQHPNGIQLFVKDQNFNSQFGTWRNIGSTRVPVNQWAEVQLTPSTVNPPDGYTDPGFDPTKIMIVGLKIGVGTNSQVPFQGTCYLDFVNLSREPLIVPPSDHVFNFDELSPTHHLSKKFGYGPYFDADENWNADAWNSDDITVRDGMVAITSTFTVVNNASPDDPRRKGFIGVNLQPNLDLRNKSNRVIRVEVKFDPYLEPEKMQAAIYLYDRRDSCNEALEECEKWYRSRPIWVGGSVWNELVFDLDDPSQFDPCADCLQHDDITADSLMTISRVGIQLYANESYSGTIYLDNVTIGGTEIVSNFNNCNKSLVRRSGSQFLVEGNPYRFAGTNNYYLFYKSHYMMDDLFATMQRNGLRVARTWGFSDGNAPFAEDGDGIANGNEGSAFQPELRLYYEPTFVNFDYAIKSAGEHCVRLIIPLVNHWSDKDTITGTNSFGGMAQYLEWCGIAPIYDASTGYIINKNLFYTDQCVIDAYKDYITEMLSRENTLTGKDYKDDPTILAWELANEPRCPLSEGCPSFDIFYNWVVTISEHIKSLDSNHLIAIGDEGFLNQPDLSDDIYYNGYFGIDWEKNLRDIDNIDFGTVHVYPDHWDKDLAWATKWITDHIRIAQEIGKPVVFEEFGICDPYDTTDHCEPRFNRDEVYAKWTTLFEQGAASALVWMIAGKVNNADEAHVTINCMYYFPDYDGFTFWEPSSTMGIIREHASMIPDPYTFLYLPLLFKNYDPEASPPINSCPPSTLSPTFARDVMR